MTTLTFIYMTDNNLLLFGTVASLKGLKGELNVNPETEMYVAEQIKKIYIKNKTSFDCYDLLKLGKRKEQFVILLSEVDSCEKAEKLKNKTLYFDKTEIILPKSRNFIKDLIGLTVINANDARKIYGTVKEIIKYPANDVWVILGDNGSEYLIPGVKSILDEIDLKKGIVKINEVEGLFDDN